MIENVCGIKRLTFNNQDYLNVFYSVKLKLAMDTATMTCYYEGDKHDTLDWSPREALVIVEEVTPDDADWALFGGYVNNTGQGGDEGTSTLEVRIDDRKTQLDRELINQTFLEGTTVTEAIRSIAAAIQEDTWNIVEINEPCEFKFKNFSMKKAIEACMALADRPLRWRCRYNLVQHKFVHDIGYAFEDGKAGTLGNAAELELKNGQFRVNESEIRNIIVVNAKNLPQKSPFEQYNFFIDYGDSVAVQPVDSDDMDGIPLSMAPNGGLQVFLLVGKGDATDYRDVIKAEKWVMPVEAYDNDSRGAIGQDITKFLKGNSTYFIPSNTNKQQNMSSERITVGAGYTDSEAIQASINFTQGIKTIMIGLYDPRFTCKYQSKPLQQDKVTQYGLVWVWSLSYLKRYIKHLQEAMNRQIEASQLLGYLITYNFNQDDSQSFQDDESILEYGKHPLTLPSMQFTTRGMMQKYGEAKLAEMSEPKRTGSVTGWLYANGEKLAPFTPVPGQVCDIQVSDFPLEEDVNIKNVDLNFTDSGCDMTVSSEKVPSGGILGQALKRLDAILQHSRNSDQQGEVFQSNVKVKETLTIDMGTPVCITSLQKGVSVWTDGKPLIQLPIV